MTAHSPYQQERYRTYITIRPLHNERSSHLASSATHLAAITLRPSSRAGTLPPAFTVSADQLDTVPTNPMRMPIQASFVVADQEGSRIPVHDKRQTDMNCCPDLVIDDIDKP